MMSLDEGYLDITERVAAVMSSEDSEDADRSEDEVAQELVRQLRAEICRRTQLTASAGEKGATGGVSMGWRRRIGHRVDSGIHRTVRELHKLSLRKPKLIWPINVGLALASHSLGAATLVT